MTKTDAIANLQHALVDCIEAGIHIGIAPLYGAVHDPTTTVIIPGVSIDNGGLR